MLGSEKGACIICGMSKFKQDCSATKTWWNTESGEVMSKAIISNLFHFLFSKKMWVIRGLGWNSHTCQNYSKQGRPWSDCFFSSVCLEMFDRQLVFGILEHLPYCLVTEKHIGNNEGKSVANIGNKLQWLQISYTDYKLVRTAANYNNDCKLVAMIANW